MAVGSFFLCSPDCPKQSRTSFPSYKFFYTIVFAKVSVCTQLQQRRSTDSSPVEILHIISKTSRWTEIFFIPDFSILKLKNVKVPALKKYVELVRNSQMTYAILKGTFDCPASWSKHIEHTTYQADFPRKLRFHNQF